jgi:hypothetical protein
MLALSRYLQAGSLRSGVLMVRTRSGSDRVLQQKMFALSRSLQAGSLRSNGSLRSSRFDL